MNVVSGGQEKDRRYINLQQRATKNQRFEFSSYELALQVREVVYLKLIEFDSNDDQQFQEAEIREFLVKVLHQNQHQIHYFVKNVFRYDYNNDGVIEYDELVNFCMEQHFGEIAIQRLHRRKIYAKGAERKMNFDEFQQTIRYALGFIGFSPQEEAVRQCFQAVDANQDGYISYEDYFRFLKEYFGSKSMAAKLVHKSSVIEQLKHQGDIKRELSILKRYSKYEGKQDLGGKRSGENGNKGSNNPNSATINSNAAIHNDNNNLAPHGRLNLPGSITSSDASSLIHSQSAEGQGSGGNNPSAININFTNSTLNYSSSNQGSSLHNKKPHNPKLELTILSTHKHKREVCLTEAQSLLADRIARLVYIQVKAALIYYDHDLDCALTLDNLQQFIKRTMPCGDNDQFAADITKKYHLSSDKLYSYDEATRAVIAEHISRLFRGLEEKEVDQREFVQLSEKICSVAKFTPLKFRYESLFESRQERRESMALSEVQQLYVYIFDNYPKS